MGAVVSRGGRALRCSDCIQHAGHAVAEAPQESLQLLSFDNACRRRGAGRGCGIAAGCGSEGEQPALGVLRGQRGKQLAALLAADDAAQPRRRAGRRLAVPPGRKLPVRELWIEALLQVDLQPGHHHLVGAGAAGLTHRPLSGRGRAAGSQLQPRGQAVRHRRVASGIAVAMVSCSSIADPPALRVRDVRPGAHARARARACSVLVQLWWIDLTLPIECNVILEVFVAKRGRSAPVPGVACGAICSAVR